MDELFRCQVSPVRIAAATNDLDVFDHVPTAARPGNAVIPALRPPAFASVSVIHQHAAVETWLIEIVGQATAVGAGELGAGCAWRASVR